MIAAGDVRDVVRETIQQIEARAVPERRVVDPVDAADVMIGVEAAAAVLGRYAEADNVPRNRTRQPLDRRTGMTAGLEAIAVGGRPALRREAVPERHAVLEYHGFVGAETVESVVAVQPCPTAAEDVPAASRRRMTAEPVDIAPAPVLGCVIVIVPCIAVDEEIVAAVDVIDADGLTVVHGEPGEDVVTALAFEADRLRVALDGDLNPGHLEPFDPQPRAPDGKGGDALP